MTNRPLANLGEGLDAKMRYDQRFKPAADPAVVADLDDRPIGAEVKIRTITFTKIDARTWANDFRTGLTSREVASVLAEA